VAEFANFVNDDGFDLIGVAHGATVSFTQREDGRETLNKRGMLSQELDMSGFVAGVSLRDRFAIPGLNEIHSHKRSGMLLHLGVFFDLPHF
jgi:hypothetical protein